MKLFSVNGSRWPSSRWPGSRWPEAHVPTACLQGRLLHYFPPEADRHQPCQQSIPTSGNTQHTLTSSDGAQSPPSPAAEDLPADSWCGEHTDHGALTGLTAAMYQRGPDEVPCPDFQAGLYIRTCRRQLFRVSIPADHLAFQMGETFQVTCPHHGAKSGCRAVAWPCCIHQSSFWA